MAKPTSDRGAPTTMVELLPYEKDLIRAHATDLAPEVERQLRDGRYVWIEFTHGDLDDITGSLSFACNRTENCDLAVDLDLVCNLLESPMHAMAREARVKNNPQI